MLYLNNNIDYTKYSSAIVYIKDDTIHKLTIKGNIEEVFSDNNILSIKTNSNYNVFEISNIIAIDFV